MNLFPSLIKWSSHHPTIAALVVGTGYGLPFVWPLLWPLAVAAIVAVFWLSFNLSTANFYRFCIIVWGTKALLVLSTCWSTFPITWLPDLSYTTELIAIFLYWVSSAVWLSSAGVVVALVWQWRHCLPTWLQLWYVAVGIIVAEYFGAVIFSVMTIGPGAYISGAFSFGHTGYLFPFLAPLAQWLGVYTVGFGAVVVILALGYRLFHLPRQSAKAAIVLVLLWYVISLFTLSSTTIQSTIALIQTTTPPGVVNEEAKITALRAMTDIAFSQNPEYVIYPEDSRYLTEGYAMDQVGPVDAVAAYNFFHPHNKALIIDSGRTIDPITKQVVQRAYIFDATNQLYTADKQYLVPQGEYMPSLYTAVLRLSGLGVAADYLGQTINYTVGTAQLPKETPVTIPNILFCFESVSPLAAKQLQKERRAEFIVHPMSHSWFHTPTVVWSQLETMLRFQSIAARVPIISVGNDVRGQLYLPNGKIVVPTTVTSTIYGTVDVIENI
jgi:hypothetical protein